MITREHGYRIGVTWTGNTGTGTSAPGAYARDCVIAAAGKQPIPGSSDPAFRGDPTRYNPEELLVAALSQCHMLWYLGLCAGAGIVVTAYDDDATGTMIEHADGSGEFTSVTLRPVITLAESSQQQQADALHERAHHLCFIARSVTFAVTIEPTYR